jgi:dihydrofolate reductase
MSMVVLDTSTSLDGFTTASNRRPDEPMGDGGQRLHEWAFGQDKQNRRYLEDVSAGLVAVIAGRETYDTPVPWWGADGPSGPARRPVFVVTTPLRRGTCMVEHLGDEHVQLEPVEVIETRQQSTRDSAS